jgi:bacterioferritin
VRDHYGSGFVWEASTRQLQTEEVPLDFPRVLTPPKVVVAKELTLPAPSNVTSAIVPAGSGRDLESELVIQEFSNTAYPPLRLVDAEPRKHSFLTDIQEIRRRARQHIQDGAVTDSYKGDRAVVLRVLNEALATEIVCVLRYKRHHYMAKGLHSQAVAEEFLEHAAEEQGHADQIAERITQLDGEPNFNPEGMLTRSHPEYIEGETLVEMIREDLVAERIAVESYSEIIRYLGDNDSTSRRMMEEILAKEEEHAEDMKTLLL